MQQLTGVASKAAAKREREARERALLHKHMPPVDLDRVRRICDQINAMPKPGAASEAAASNPEPVDWEAWKIAREAWAIVNRLLELGETEWTP